VSILSALDRRFEALAHESAHASPLELTKHTWFILSKLAISLCALILAPAVFITSGGFNPALVLCVALTMVPLAAVIYVSRTGKLLVAQAACFSVMLALPNVLSFGGLVPAAATVIWLAVLPVEVLLTSDRRMMESIVGLSVASIVLAIGRGLLGVDQFDVATSLLEAMVMISGMLYLAAVAMCGTRLGALRDTDQRDLSVDFDSLSHTAGDLIVKFDRGGAIIVASQQSEQLFGLPSFNLTGRGFFERVHVADRPAFLQGLNEAAQGASVACFRLRFRGGASAMSSNFADPVFHWIELRVSAQGPKGTTLFAVIRDVSKLARHEEELEQARADAERANLLKDRFLANVSHELRTPLNAIIGFSEMLGSEELRPREPAKLKEYADIIHGSGEHLLSVVNTILDMSKMQAGNFSLDFESFEVSPLIDSCCDMLRLKAEQGGMAFVRDIAPGLGAMTADKRALKQVLINLLSNAVKFTPFGGEIAIQARPDGNSLRVTVSDTGIGIAPQDLSRLGDPFFQAKSTYDRPYEGTGLGLSLVRGLVGLHGGSISVESAPGQGTRVSIRLPLECTGAAAMPAGAKIETVVRFAPPPKETRAEAPAELVKLRA
jgi:two-component system, cell cycle sensor histidine kinase DivJ